MRKSFFLVLLGLIIAMPAFAVDGVLSSPIANYERDRKAIYGNYVVLEGSNGIALYDIEKGTTSIIGYGSYPGIFGETVIWADSTLGNNIVKYDISTGSKTQVSTEGNATSGHRPWIQGNKIVWSGLNDYIQVHNIVTGQTIALTVMGTYATVYGNKLAYLDAPDIRLYDLETGTDVFVGTQYGMNYSPMIDANYVAWEGQGQIETYAIKSYNISTGQVSTFDDCGSPYTPKLSNGKVYVDSNCGGPEYWRVRQLDLKTGVISPLAVTSGKQIYCPAVYEDKIVVSHYESGVDNGSTRIFDLTSPGEEIYSLNVTANSVTVINPYNQSIVPSSLTVSGPSDARLSPEEKRLYILNSDKSITIAETYAAPDFKTIIKAPVSLSGSQSITAITGDDEGNAYITIKKTGSATQVWKVDSAGGISVLQLQPPIAGSNPTGIKISKEGTQYKLFVSDGTTGNMTTINLLNLTTSTIAAGTGSKIVKP